MILSHPCSFECAVYESEHLRSWKQLICAISMILSMRICNTSSAATNTRLICARVWVHRSEWPEQVGPGPLLCRWDSTTMPFTWMLMGKSDPFRPCLMFFFVNLPKLMWMDSEEFQIPTQRAGTAKFLQLSRLGPHQVYGNDSCWWRGDMCEREQGFCIGGERECYQSCKHVMVADLLRCRSRMMMEVETHPIIVAQVEFLFVVWKESSWTGSILDDWRIWSGIVLFLPVSKLTHISKNRHMNRHIRYQYALKTRITVRVYMSFLRAPTQKLFSHSHLQSYFLFSIG